VRVGIVGVELDRVAVGRRVAEEVGVGVPG